MPKNRAGIINLTNGAVEFAKPTHYLSGGTRKEASIGVEEPMFENSTPAVLSKPTAVDSMAS